MHRIMFILASVFFGFFLALGFLIGLFEKMDSLFYQLAEVLSHPLFLKINKIISILGSGPFLLVTAGLLGIYLIYKSHVKISIWYFLVIGIGLQINAACKVFFKRFRPEFFDINYSTMSYSFPSGHSLGIFIFVVMTLYIFWHLNLFKKDFKKLFISGISIILIVGMTRIFLGVHWLSDLLGGYLLGASWCLLNMAYAEKEGFLKNS